ncbi:MAG: TetR/AcrR family transcriptional regulator [Acidobacteria bacterium]|nr:TetR/AcrR family transcriptional regulator [Acidobacteriota bacterium]
MNLSNRRAEYRENLREDILDAARQLFLVHGFEDTSIRSIASKVGASPGVLYHYFEDKQHIMAVLVRETFSRLSARLEAIRADNDTAQARMRRGLRAYIEFGLEFPHHYTLIFVKPNTIEGNERIYAAFMEDGMKTFGCLRSISAEIVAGGFAREQLVDAEELAQSLWVSIHGLVSTQISIKTFPWIERMRLIDRQIDILMHGVLRH